MQICLAPMPVHFSSQHMALFTMFIWSVNYELGSPNVIYSYKLILFSSQLLWGTKLEMWQSLQQCGREVRTGFQIQMTWKYCSPKWTTSSTIKTFLNGPTWISSGVWMPLTVCTMKSYIWWSRKRPAFPRKRVRSGCEASDMDGY